MSTHRGSMGAPPATGGVPTTAPVLDYVCLFTHDLKRKQKRWQDGKLKYHTFNKRVMVYDEKANFIGDMHWNEDYDFGDGEEFQLERGCVIVQVAECVGSKEQDLSELIEKRYKDKEQRQARAAAAAAATPSRSRPTTAPVSRPLADVSTTPRANYIGRAVIQTESPFEQRQAQNGETPSENARPTKRRKHDISPPSKSGYAQNLFGAPLSLSSWSASGQTSRNQESNDNPQIPAVPSIPTGPSYRSQTTASLLQKIRRDRPTDSSLENDRPVNPMAARKTFSGRPQAASTTARNVAPLSVQPRQPARPKTQKFPFGRGPDAAPNQTPSRRARDAPSADEGSSDDDVVETFSRPVRPSPNTHKRAPSPKASPPRKKKTAPKPFSAPKPQPRSRVLGKPVPAEAVEQEPLHTPDLDQDEVPEAPMLVSTTKPSRRRRLLLVSGPQASKGAVSSVESSIQPNTSRPVIRPPPEVAPVSEPVDSGQTDDPPTQAPKPKNKSRPPSNPFVDFDSSESDVPMPNRRADRQSAARTSRSRRAEEETDDASDGPSTSTQDINPFSDDDVQDFPSAQAREPSLPPPRRQRKQKTPAAMEDPVPPAPKPAPSEDTAHRFVAPRARLATLRRGVKSKEVLFWPEDEALSEEEPEKPVEAETKTKPPAAPTSKSSGAIIPASELPVVTDVAKAFTGPKSKPMPPTVVAPEPQATTDATKASIEAKELVAVDITQRSSIRQTRQLSKPVEEKVETSAAEQKPDTPPTEPMTDAPKITRQQELPVSVPAPVAAAEPSIPNVQAVQSNVSFHSEPEALANVSFRSEPGIQSPQKPDAAAKPRQVPSSEPTGGQKKPITKQIPSAMQDKENLADVPAVTTNARRSMSATSTSAPPPQIPGQRPRIVNPATRGRKAALKTDAAGQLPQTVVPAALPPTTINQLRMAVPIPMPAPVPIPVPIPVPALVRKESVTRTKPNLPGFSRAGGGAWSKTAHDLLGMERPA
ncbi:hypothetical protein F5X68DRAFT_204674 [Plectosphaerella plurivora]|uniref:5'-3' DNA helicase ZGRF1-like N-terminal domain-containing protein n=1 Tax=Plectosphaerella plurivora TaxID=936078 RepID=A0A9P8VDY2_9PEZI|nr:hypothetical protein F5X68DRAFT_204674 [Plectosphaerella plurivora]